MDIEEAWQTWRARYHNHYQADLAVEPYLELPVTVGWLKRAREGLQLSTPEMARRLGIKSSTYCGIETHEESAKLKTLKKCAAAMDCDLVYAIRSKSRKPFSRIIWDLTLRNIEIPADPVRLIYEIRSKMYDPDFRREQKWASNSNPDATSFLWWREINRMLDRQTNLTKVRVRD